MATIIVRESDESMYLLEAGKLVYLDRFSRPGPRRDALYVSDERFAVLVEAFGPVL